MIAPRRRYSQKKIAGWRDYIIARNPAFLFVLREGWSSAADPGIFWE